MNQVSNIQLYVKLCLFNLGTSPFSIHRSRSLPLKRHNSGNSSTQERSEKLDKHLSLPSDFDVNDGTTSLSLPDVSESMSGGIKLYYQKLTPWTEDVS